jgi:hypothetical protein
MGALSLRRQDNSPVLNIRFQRIPGTNIEPATKRTGKNDLPLSGNFGLHGKTILPMLKLVGKGHVNA